MSIIRLIKSDRRFFLFTVLSFLFVFSFIFFVVNYRGSRYHFYFESTDTAKNRKFVSAYKEAFGENKAVGDPVEAAYIAVNLWASSCAKAGTFDVEPVRIAAKGMSYIAPEGIVTIEGTNQHLYKKIRIGQIDEKGQINELYASSAPVRPDPYLSTYAWAKGL